MPFLLPLGMAVPDFFQKHLSGKQMTGRRFRIKVKQSGECGFALHGLTTLNVGVPEHIIRFRHASHLLKPGNRLRSLGQQIVTLPNQKHRLFVLGRALLFSCGVGRQDDDGLGIVARFELSDASRMRLSAGSRENEQGQRQEHVEKTGIRNRETTCTLFYLGLLNYNEIGLKLVLLCWSAVLLSVLLEAQSSAALLTQAEQAIRRGDSQGALALLQKASRLTPHTAESEDRTGFLLAVLSHQEDARDHFERALSIDPNFAAAHFHLGVAYWLMKDPGRALPELERAAQIVPTSFEYRYRLGAAYLGIDKFQEASTELKEAVGLDNSKAPAWISLGQSLKKSGDLAAAVEAYSNALTLSPEDNQARDEYASLLIETRQPARAIQESQRVLRNSPKDLNAQLNIGYANLKAGDFQKAEVAYRGAVVSDANSPAAHYDLGLALKMQDQFDSAQKEFHSSIALDPSLAEAHYALGLIAWQSGDFDNMIEEMNAALAVRPSYAEAHYLLGIALKSKEDLAGAVRELKEAIRLDPSTPGPYNTLGQILRVQGDRKGSEDAFAAGAKLKRERDGQLANILEQGMRGGGAAIPAPMKAPSQ